MITETVQRVLAGKIIAIARGLGAEAAVPLAEALLAGGIDLIEVTFDQARPETWPDTARAIAQIDARLAGRALAGAGTVMSVEQAHLAHDAGAKYIIAPNVDEAVIAAAKSMDMAAFPGAMTPTEIATAHRAGADIVKLFPAAAMGPGYIKGVRAPISHVKLMAVGGVNQQNAAEFLAAGCCGVGVGGNLVDKAWIAAGAWDKISDLARQYRRAVG